MKVGIINFESGNIKSITNFFKRNFYCDVNILKSPSLLLDESDILVIPGVGHFGHVSKHLKKTNLDTSIKSYANSNKPLIGICLGAQILTNSSEEAPDIRGLGLIDADCLSLHKHKTYKGNIPRIGWSGVKYQLKESYYFVHSYYIEVNDKKLYTLYSDDDVTALVRSKNILAMQFHPEKSDANGKNITQKFIEEYV